ncbi:hypothetical protein AVEN_72858-1 [Araneus ventricosus]|uniref:RNase H type-1 domain-containing protein n=1 Tax=Araneus ventricosus TaxID=182803 RepID=A0A4Y2WWX8_ARAVE|nr:hypothetical protein AVEN_72858-1 [Araneus ventricosus]
MTHYHKYYTESQYLGIYVDERLNWVDHINKQGQKAIKMQQNLKRIAVEDGEAYIARKDIINIFTDGSKTEHGVGAAFCVSTNDIWAYQWSTRLNDNNTVFQVQLTALHERVIYASPLPNQIPLKYTKKIKQVSWHLPIQRAQTKQQGKFAKSS